MDMTLSFSDMDMDFNDLNALPTYSLIQKSSTDRVAKLRQLLVERGIDGYLIVDSDAHYTFYAQARKDRRINYITNSEAQCGVAIVGREKCAFKPLHAYLMMADLETDENWEILHETQSLESWAQREIHGKIGYDPILTPIMIYETFVKSCKELVPIKDNLVDMISSEPKPTEPLSDLWILKQEFSGMNSHDKVMYVRQKMKENNCDCYVVTALDEIAWLLNIRGNDIPSNPVFYSYLIFLPQETFLFVDEKRLNWGVIAYTTTYASIRHRLPYAQFYNFLVSHASAFKRWWVDPRSAIAVVQALGKDKVFMHRSVIQEMKEVKNPVEISGMREAHLRDCGAVCDLFGWLENEVYSGATVKESDLPLKLTEFQKDRNHYIGPSFEAMACTAINAATVEYVADPDTCAYITPESMIMFDAGANYKDGTTDFTRTIHYGLPTDLEREIYTRVLKGMLAIEATSFPEGLTGYQIDSIIRQHMWAGGFDYPGINTGHGVSHGLGVVEGGASISGLKRADQTGLREGMIITVEPGIYLPSIFGIRLENVYVINASTVPRYTLLHPTLVKQRKFLKLETLDYIPFQRKMILDDLLTSQEWDMLREYHSTTMDRIRGQCATELGREWLERESQAWLQ